MNKKKTLIGVLSVLVLVLVTGIFAFQHFDLKDKIYLSMNLKVVNDKAMGEDIHVIQNEKNVSMWNLDLQNTVEKKLNSKAKGASFEEPFIVYNPYGTNTCAVNIMYKTKEESKLEYTVSAEDESIPDYTRIAYNGEEGNL